MRAGRRRPPLGPWPHVPPSPPRSGAPALPPRGAPVLRPPSPSPADACLPPRPAPRAGAGVPGDPQGEDRVRAGGGGQAGARRAAAL